MRSHCSPCMIWRIPLAACIATTRAWYWSCNESGPTSHKMPAHRVVHPGIDWVNNALIFPRAPCCTKSASGSDKVLPQELRADIEVAHEPVQGLIVDQRHHQISQCQQSEQEGESRTLTTIAMNATYQISYVSGLSLAQISAQRNHGANAQGVERR